MNFFSLQSTPRDVLSLIDTFSNPELSDSEHSEALNAILLDIHRKKTNVQTIIKEMKDYLTNQDDLVRGRATLLLGEIFKRLPTLKLDKDAIHYFCEFFVSRLQDHQCINRVIFALHALVQNQDLSGEIEGIIKGIQSELHVQSLVLSSRTMIFEIFSIFLEKYLEETKQMKANFVFTFIQSLDGEKDPRILLTAFRMVPIIVNTIPEYTQYAEDFFEVISCYFPITFRPKPDDPESISREDLETGLKMAMCATPKFAPYCIPFLLDKLSASNTETKLASIEALGNCIEEYGYRSLEGLENDIWTALRTEIMSSKDDDAVNQACQKLRLITNLLSEHEKALKKFIEPLLDECLHQFHTDDEKIVQNSAKIVQHTAAASQRAFNIVISAAVPLAIKKIQSDIVSTLKKEFADFLIGLIAASENLWKTDSPLTPHKDEIYNCFSLNIYNDDNESLRRSSLMGLSCLVRSNLSSSQMAKATIDRLTFIFFNDKSQNIRVQCLNLMIELSKFHKSLILDITIPQLLQHVSEKKQSQDALLADAMASLCSYHEIFQATLPRLSLVASQVLEAEQNSNSHPFVLKIIVQMISNVSNPESISVILEKLLPVLLRTIVSRSVSVEYPMNDYVMENIFDIFRLSSLKCNLSQQKTFIDFISKVFISEDVSDLSLQNIKYPFKPFHSEIESQKQSQIIFAACVIPVKKEVNIPYFPTVLSCLIAASKLKEHNLSERSSMCLGCIVNKMNLVSASEYLLNDLVIKEVKKYDSRSLALSFWVLKGLVMRGHPMGMEICKEFVQHLSSDQGENVASSFEKIISDHPFFTKDYQCNIRMLYKQKFFSVISPLLLEGFHSEENEKLKSNYMIAMANLLKHIPKSVLITQLPSVLPLMVKSLSSSDSLLRTSTLETLHTIIPEVPKEIEVHLDALINYCIDIAIQDPNMHARVAALRCLKILSALPYYKIFPFKKKVLTKLCIPLDDKKRLVRREAIKARNEWQAKWD